MKAFSALLLLAGLSCVGCGADDSALMMKNAGDAAWSDRAPEEYRHYENIEVDRTRIGSPGEPHGDRSDHQTLSPEGEWDQDHPDSDASDFGETELSTAASQGDQDPQSSGFRYSTDAIPSGLAAGDDGIMSHADEAFADELTDVEVQADQDKGVRREVGEAPAATSSSFDLDTEAFDEVYESGDLIFAVDFGLSDATSDEEYLDDVASLEDVCEAELKNNKPGHSVSHVVVHTDEIHMVCHKVDHNKNNSFTHEWKKVRVR